MSDKPMVASLEKSLVDALNEKEQEGMTFLKIENTDAPKEVVSKIRKAVDELLTKNHSKEALNEYALQLGTVWGFMVVKEYNWSWKHIGFGGDGAGIYLVSPQNFYCCPPLYFMNKILLGNNKGLDGKNDNTVLLLFNMLNGIENKTPPKNYQVIS